METACAGELKNEGQIHVQFETQEGIRSDITLQNVKVTTPIMSVRKLVKKGHMVEFWNGGGCIIAAKTGRKMYFVERGGVYYIKLKILPLVAKNSGPDFIRRG